MAFRGTHHSSLDVKNRLTIPAKRRAQLTGGVVVALQRDAPHALAIWPAEEFNAYTAEVLTGIHPLSEEYVKLERFFNAYSEELDLDAAGRVMLPAPLLAVAGLGREVALIGAGNRLEIWNRDAWAAEHGDLLQTVKDIRPGHANGHTA